LTPIISVGRDLAILRFSFLTLIDYGVAYIITICMNSKLLEPCTALSCRLDGVDTKVYMKFFVVLHTDDGERYGATVPRVMLARIDEFAKKSGQSRSGFLVEAARHVMHAG
jgi:hypothetical protein